MLCHNLVNKHLFIKDPVWTRHSAKRWGPKSEIKIWSLLVQSSLSGAVQSEAVATSLRRLFKFEITKIK